MIRHGDRGLPFASSHGEVLGAAGPELILFDAHGRASVLDAHDAADGDEFQGAAALQLGRPVDGHFHPFSGAQALLSPE